MIREWLFDREKSPLWIWIEAHTVLFWWLAILSGLVFVLSLLTVPVIIARLPRDYFLDERPPLADEFANQHPLVRWLLLIGKNLLGMVLILGGIAMLATPGQGVLTILIGFMLVNFPGKRSVERWILARSTVERVLNWIRRKRGCEPLLFPESSPAKFSRSQEKRQ